MTILNLFRRHNANAVKLAAACERAVKPCQRARRRMAIGSRNFRAAPPSRIDYLAPQTIRRIKEDLGGQGVAVLGRVIEEIELAWSGRRSLPNLGTTIIVC